MVDLSISLVNTSNWRYLEPCIQSIISNTQKITYEILVVDNASTDGSVENIAKLFPNVILSVNEKRFGFAKNNNINLRKSKGRYIILLNDDTLVQLGALDYAVRYLDENPDISGAGCQMVSPDGSIQIASGRRVPTLLTILWKELGLSFRFHKNPVFAWHTIGEWNHNTLRIIEFPSEAGWVMKKSVIEKIGLLDEIFFMYGEGADWARRIKKSGNKIVFLPESKIVHFGNVTNQRTGNIKSYLQYYKSTYLFFSKQSYWHGLIYRLLIIAIFFVKIVFFGLLYFLSFGFYKPYPDIFKYYSSLLSLMLFRLSEEHYPFNMN